MHNLTKKKNHLYHQLVKIIGKRYTLIGYPVYAVFICSEISKNGLPRRYTIRVSVEHLIKITVTRMNSS